MKAKQIKIKDRNVSEGWPAFIIAEAGINHNADIALAKKLIDAAKKAKADAVKFQTFQTEKILSPDIPQADYQKRNSGKDESMYDMAKRVELSYEDFRILKKYCDQAGIIFLSTPHSCNEDIDIVSELAPAIKIASGDLTNLPAIKYAAGKGLPLIISTGMATLNEVKEAVETVLPINKNLILLHCVTNYPAGLNEVNLKAMLTMKNAFHAIVGYSDHTLGINVAIAAVVLGAKVIEKHLTLDKNLPGPDHKASLEPDEFKNMVDGIRGVEAEIVLGRKAENIIKKMNIDEALGDGVKKPNTSELAIAKLARKSIVASADIKSGEKIKEEMLMIKRPGTGIAPKHLREIVGRFAFEDIKIGELIQWEKISHVKK